jgi:ribonuclease Z
MDPALPNVMHDSELLGTDFIADADGFWRGITSGKGRYHGVDINVDAGPIQHRGKILMCFFIETNDTKVVRSMYRLRLHRKSIPV